MFEFLGILSIGLVVGILAKAIMPGKGFGGLLTTALLGIAGSVFGNFIGKSLPLYEGVLPSGFLTSLVGALAILAIYRLITPST